MEEKQLESWNDFEKEVQNLLRVWNEMKAHRRSTSDLIFRGQSDSEWHLDTTLERVVGKKQRLTEYHVLILGIKERIETFTGNRWEVPELAEFTQKLEDYDSMRAGYLPIEYMVYLRHHGFPSPLLDWSKSPYIAAYFAFRDFQSDADSVAIFAYIEHAGVKAGYKGHPFIKNIGPYIRSDKRHFLQQCEYTYCTGIEDEKPLYFSHEDVFMEKLSPVQQQDFLWKLILPASERRNALRSLELYNINAYSLFGSEESLMESVFVREHYLK